MLKKLELLFVFGCNIINYFRSLFPSLTKLSLRCSGIDDCESHEPDFVEFVSGQKPNLENIRHVSLTFSLKSDNCLTGKSVLAILSSCSNLQFFENLINFNLTDSEKVS